MVLLQMIQRRQAAAAEAVAAEDAVAMASITKSRPIRSKIRKALISVTTSAIGTVTASLIVAKSSRIERNSKVAETKVAKTTPVVEAVAVAEATAAGAAEAGVEVTEAASTTTAT